jgi:hypothetical protein
MTGRAIIKSKDRIVFVPLLKVEKRWDANLLLSESINVEGSLT